MMTTILNTADLVNFSVPTNSKNQSSPSVRPTGNTDFSTFYHPEAGTLALKAIEFPHMYVMDMRWEINNDLDLRDTIQSDRIAINFVLNGMIDSRFRGLNHDLNMRSNTHNLVHTPESGHRNLMKGGQQLTSLLIDLDKDFFASSIGACDRWSESVLSNLQQERPFSGVQESHTITPQMRYLIEDIRHCKAQGPMRNLLIQSRVLELVALEIDQFRTPPVIVEAMPPDEIEKLLHLKTYLEVNFLAEHTLAQLSRFCLLNEFKVKKGFKQLFDTTVFSYLRKLRMDYAGQLLRDTSLSVDEIADKLGYEHSQHFSIAFKKYTGQTPTAFQYRRAN